MLHVDADEADAASHAAGAISGSGWFARVLEIWPGAIYELRLRTLVDYRVTIDCTGDDRWAYVVDATVQPAHSWRRITEISGDGLPSAATALERAAERIARFETPFGD